MYIFIPDSGPFRTTFMFDFSYEVMTLKSCDVASYPPELNRKLFSTMFPFPKELFTYQLNTFTNSRSIGFSGNLWQPKVSILKRTFTVKNNSDNVIPRYSQVF